MNQFISDWLDYCEGTTGKDASDFIGLLSGRWEDRDLLTIFRLVPMREALIANLKRLYESSDDQTRVYLRPKPENAATPDELQLIAARFIDSQRRFLLQHDIDDETRAWFDKLDIPMSFLAKDEFESIANTDSDLGPYIRDQEAEFRGFRAEVGLSITTADCIEYRVISGITEALYGLACDYYLAWFALSPILDTEIDYGIYFDFWAKGGRYVLTDSQILVSSIWNKKNAE